MVVVKISIILHMQYLIFITFRSNAKKIHKNVENWKFTLRAHTCTMYIRMSFMRCTWKSSWLYGPLSSCLKMEWKMIMHIIWRYVNKTLHFIQKDLKSHILNIMRHKRCEIVFFFFSDKVYESKVILLNNCFGGKRISVIISICWKH